MERLTTPIHVAIRILDGNEPIRVWREERGLAVEQLAKQAGINPFRMLDIELGMEAPEEAELNRLAGVLGVKASDLLVPQDDSYDTPVRINGEVHGYMSGDADEIPW